MGNSRLLTPSLLILISAIFVQHSFSSALSGPEPEAERVAEAAAEKELIEGDDSGAPGAPGGLGPVYPADAHTRQMVISLAVEYEICKLRGTRLSVCGSAEMPTMVVLSYRAQVVNGLMYFVKVQYGKAYWHVKIHEATTKKLRLEGCQGPKTRNDPILFFVQ